MVCFLILLWTEARPFRGRLKQLYEQNCVRFVSNESSGTRKALCDKLHRLGFVEVQPEHIFTPAPVAVKYLLKHGLRPELLVHKDDFTKERTRGHVWTRDMGLGKDEVVMVGDDIQSDVGAAQQVGMCGVQVRTGKWRPEWEQHPTVIPDMIADNLLEAVSVILNQKDHLFN
uniref:Haloacid dehalogenase-like hydrolase domain-containing protein 3 n=1 Tax=Globodera pallida TaxID=36090 RepID=A0A183C6U9_GLOPA